MKPLWPDSFGTREYAGLARCRHGRSTMIDRRKKGAIGACGVLVVLLQCRWRSVLFVRPS